MVKRFILIVLYVVVLVSLSVAIILSFNHKNTPTIKNPQVTINHLNKNQSTANNNKSKSSTANNHPSSSSSNSNLANSGPGNILGIFLISTSIGTILYWRLLRQKAILK